MMKNDLEKVNNEGVEGKKNFEDNRDYLEEKYHVFIFIYILGNY